MRDRDRSWPADHRRNAEFALIEPALGAEGDLAGRVPACQYTDEVDGLANRWTDTDAGHLPGRTDRQDKTLVKGFVRPAPVSLLSGCPIPSPDLTGRRSSYIRRPKFGAIAC